LVDSVAERRCGEDKSMTSRSRHLKVKAEAVVKGEILMVEGRWYFILTHMSNEGAGNEEAKKAGDDDSGSAAMVVLTIEAKGH
jgi:hypothetical protein